MDIQSHYPRFKFSFICLLLYNLLLQLKVSGKLTHDYIYIYIIAVSSFIIKLIIAVNCVIKLVILIKLKFKKVINFKR